MGPNEYLDEYTQTIVDANRPKPPEGYTDKNVSTNELEVEHCELDEMDLNTEKDSDDEDQQPKVKIVENAPHFMPQKQGFEALNSIEGVEFAFQSLH